jgi:hypothetical protein
MRIGSIILVGLLAAAPAGEPPVLVATTVTDSEGDDAWHAIAAVDQGAVAVGRMAAPPVTGREPLGRSPEGWTYGHGVVMRFNATGAIVACQSFARDLFLPTAVVAAGDAVWVGGYAAPPMAELIGGLGGLQSQADWSPRTWRTWCPPEHHSEPLRKDATDQRGVPCVLRLSADLARLTGGTFLEGWQSAWHIPEPLREDDWQPLHLALTVDGDLVVGHDGGYCLPPAAGESPSFEHFYSVGDHLSRLSPDLTVRRWHTVYHSPRTDAAKVLRYQDASGHFTMKWGTPRLTRWDHDFLGQPRTLRLRLDAADRIYCAGWSPTRTAGEPWWSPFCLRFDPVTGAEDGWRIYTPDPMSGGGDRLDGLVSDACVRSLAPTADGRLLLSLTGDGGNNVLTRDPVDHTRPVAIRGSIGPFSGRHLFWGGWTLVDPADRSFVRGHYVGRPVMRPWRRGQQKPLQQDMWIVDLVDTPRGGVAAIGRFKDGLDTTAEAWCAGAGLAAGGFLHLYDATGAPIFSTALPGCRLYELRRAGDRLWLAGERRLPDDRGAAAVCLVVDVPGE